MEFDEIFEKLENVRYYARNNFVPIIRDKSAKFLYKYVSNNGINEILEIGTAIGYSASIMINAGAKKITTIDINADYLNMAKELFETLKISDKIEIINNDAMIVIRELLSKNRKFDMIFLDGAKGQYFRYLPILVQLLNTNGVIFADNVFLGGLVESDDFIPHKKRSMVNNLRIYLDMISKEPFETEIVRLEDGIAITKVKGD